ncbi:MAG TPA: signal peptidase II [Pseudolabrys sp.]|nr:signal peptidase II [Pseudolabrys sp.]
MIEARAAQVQRFGYLSGPLTRFGIIVAAIVFALDQLSKFYLVSIFQLGARGPVHVAPFTDLVLTHNTGISYGLLQNLGPLGQWLLFGFKIVAVVLLWVWLARSTSRLSALALGLIIGGAFGNAIDRLTYRAVVDFVYFHVNTASWSFNWYVFNLADVAIVAGVIGLLYESLAGTHAAKAP